jgi:hypothetical protein
MSSNRHYHNASCAKVASYPRLVGGYFDIEMIFKTLLSGYKVNRFN